MLDSHLETGPTLEGDVIVLATGLVTDQRIAKSADLRSDNGLIVDSKTLETSQKEYMPWRLYRVRGSSVPVRGAYK